MPAKDNVQIAPAEGKLGILIPGIGAVSTTFIAGVEAIKRGLGLPVGLGLGLGLPVGVGVGVGEVAGASKGAREAVEKAGGSVVTTFTKKAYMNKKGEPGKRRERRVKSAEKRAARNAG